jgi:rsbT co-antagonist protein RsbR
MKNADSRIEDLLEVIGRAAAQDFSVATPVTGSPDGLGALEAGIAGLVQDLKETKDRNREAILEIEAKNREIAERQSMALRELSTPIISVWDGVLALPIIGTVDTGRSADMMDTLLARVVSDSASFVIIDITGVSMVDTRTADHFIRMAKAVRLLGAKCFLTGMSPAIAQTLSQLGIDTSSVQSVRRLSDALRIAFDEIGHRPGKAAANAMHPSTSPIP